MQYAWLILLFFSAKAQTAQELFLQANQCYLNKDYTSALKLYDQISQKGPATWYNMGNCAYKNGNNLQALLYWSRAGKNSNERIMHDSALNRSALMNKLQTPLEKAHPLKSVHPLMVQILFFCAFRVFLVIIRILIQRKKIIILSLYGIFLGGVGFLTYAVYNQSQYSNALVMSNEAIVYAGPDDNYHQIETIPAGSTVLVLKPTKDWSKIKWHNHVGWIANNTIEVI